MGITTFRGETNLGELVAKLYPDLKAAKKKKAEKALLRANPQLRSLADLDLGALLVVPEVADARLTTQADTEQPGAHIAKAIATALGDYRKQLIEAAKRNAEQARETRKALEEREIAEAIGTEAARNINEAATAREKQSEVLQAFADEELGAAQTDLAALIDRLS